MKKDIFLLEYVLFYGYDTIDDEKIEDRYVIGFFTSKEKLEEAKKNCLMSGLNKKCFVVTDYIITMNYNQEYVYVLYYEYSKLIDDKYEDYYYYFEPQSNVKKCIELKNKLKNDKFYQHNNEKIYYDSTDGFLIKKIKLDFISAVGILGV